MDSIRFRTLALFALIISLTGAHAAINEGYNDTSSSSRFQVYRSDEFAAVNPQGWWMFLGLSTGFLDYNNSGSYNSGSQVQSKIGGSYFFEEYFNLDTYLGISSSHIQRDNSADNHLSGIIEANFKFELDPYVDIGPAFLSMLGNGDRFNSNINSFTSFIGLGIFKDFVIEEKNIFRVGLRLLTDLSVRSGDLQMYLVDFQLGLPFKTRADVAANIPMALPATSYKASLESKALHEIRLSEKFVSPNGIEESKLQTLALELSRNPGLVDRVEILTPGLKAEKRTKGPKVQRILYESRAKHFEALFIKHGVQREKLVSILGPANDEVKIRFIGVSDAAVLSDILARSGWTN
jgi:hypothetical protein